MSGWHIRLILLHEVIVRGSRLLPKLPLLGRRNLVRMVACRLPDGFHVLRYYVVFTDHRLLGLALLRAKSATLTPQIVRLLSTLRVLTAALLHAVHVAIEGVVVTAGPADVQAHVVVLTHLGGYFLLRHGVVETLYFGGERRSV